MLPKHTTRRRSWICEPFVRMAGFELISGRTDLQNEDFVYSL